MGPCPAILLERRALCALPIHPFSPAPTARALCSAAAFWQCRARGAARRLLLNTARGARIIRAQFSVNTIGFIYLLYSGWRASVFIYIYTPFCLCSVHSFIVLAAPAAPESISVSQNIPSAGRLAGWPPPPRNTDSRFALESGDCIFRCVQQYIPTPTATNKSSCQHVHSMSTHMRSFFQLATVEHYTRNKFVNWILLAIFFYMFWHIWLSIWEQGFFY